MVRLSKEPPQVQQPSLSVGSYVLVENGQNQLPACVVHTHSLAVRYFERCSSDGLFSANDAAYELLESDILRNLGDPTPIPRGSRIYYTFVEL